MLPYLTLFHNVFWVLFVFDDGLQAWVDPFGIEAAHDRLRAQPLQTKVAIFALVYDPTACECCAPSLASTFIRRAVSAGTCFLLAFFMR